MRERVVGVSVEDDGAEVARGLIVDCEQPSLLPSLMDTALS